MNDEYDSEDIKGKIKDQIIKSMQELNDQLSSYKEKLEKFDLSFLEKANEWAMKDIEYFYEKQDSQSALVAIASVENLSAQVLCFESQFSLSDMKIKLNLMGWLSHIKNVIKSISIALWNLITRLITLENWSISGGLTGSLFGMVKGTMQLQLTFGK